LEGLRFSERQDTTNTSLPGLPLLSGYISSRSADSFCGFYWLGTAFIAAGIAGTAVGLAGGGLGGIEVTTGFDRCGKPVCGRWIYRYQSTSQQPRLTGWRCHAATTSIGVVER
jgi:hypothetical protein